MQPLTFDLMDASNAPLIPLDIHSANDFIPRWALSPPNMTQLLEHLEQLQTFQKKHAQAISELQKLATIAQRPALPPRATTKEATKGPDEVKDQAPVLVLIDCTSVAFKPELVDQGREGGKKFVDDLTRQIEANYAETKRSDDAKEIWTCIEIFVSEGFAQGDGPQDRKMRDFLKGVTDAINVKLVRVYNDNTTSLAWKLAVTAQNWFERNPARYCYVASCDEKTYGCFNSANRTRLRLLAQQEADPEDIDDLEEYEETRRRRGGFEMVDVGELLLPKGRATVEEEMAVVSTVPAESPPGLEVKVPSPVIGAASHPGRKALSPPRSAYDLVKHCLGQVDRIKVGSEVTKQPVVLPAKPTTFAQPVGRPFAQPVKQLVNVKPIAQAIARSSVPARPGPPPVAAQQGRLITLPEPPHPTKGSPAKAAAGFDFSKGLREFGPLYAALVSLNREHKENRYHQAGQVGQRLGGRDYKRSGYSSYKDYVLAAQRAGLVWVLAEGSALWIALNVAHAHHTLAHPKQTEAKGTRIGSSSDPVWLSRFEQEPTTPGTVGAPYWISEPDSPPISLV